MDEPLELSFKQQRVFRWLVWGFAISMVLHNLEELLRMLPFIEEHAGEFPAFLRQLANQWQPQSFALAIWAINIVAILLAWYISGHPASRKVHWLAALLATLMLVNAFSHIGQSLYLHALAPGVVTAVVLILPCTLSLLIMEHCSGLLNARQQLLLLVIAVPLMLAVIILLINLAGWITNFY